MNKDEEKRYKKLTEKPYAYGSIPPLNYDDLLFLLEVDDNIRDIIFDRIRSAKNNESVVEEEQKSQPDVLPQPQPTRIEYRDREVIKEVVKEVRIPVERVVEKIVEKQILDPLRNELKNELSLLKAVQKDKELAQLALLDKEASEGQQLMRLTAVFSDWGEILRAWDRLKDRCKKEKRPHTPSELGILTGLLALHNLRYQEHQAELVMATVGEKFNHDQHERGTPKGQIIETVWLPGLRNTGGELQKKPLVALS